MQMKNYRKKKCCEIDSDLQQCSQDMEKIQAKVSTV